jgi:hypothetical protein
MTDASDNLSAFAANLIIGQLSLEGLEASALAWPN